MNKVALQPEGAIYLFPTATEGQANQELMQTNMNKDPKSIKHQMHPLEAPKVPPGAFFAPAQHLLPLVLMATEVITQRGKAPMGGMAYQNADKSMKKS